MTAATTTLNAGSGGDAILKDTLTTVDGAAAPASAVAQVVKAAFGAQSDARMVQASDPLPGYLAPFTVTGSLGAAGSVTIGDLKGASTVTMYGLATTMTTNTGGFEVLTAAGRWEVARFAYAAAAAGGIPIPSNAASGVTTPFASNSVRAMIDVAGYVGVRYRAVTFVGTSFDVTLTASYGASSRLGPDATAATQAVSGTVTVNATNLSCNVAQVGAAATSAIQPTSIIAAVTGAGFLVGSIASAPFTSEVASSARTTTGNSGVIGDAGGGALAAAIVISAASGTTPTLDIALQESYDNGTTWVDIYHCERATTTGTLVVPSIPLNGRRRWVWTITGTTPSFTFSIATTRGGSHPYPRQVQFFDRTAGLLSGTLNATSATFTVAGCQSVTAAFTAGAITTTGGTYKLQGSMDGTNFYDLSATVVAVANSTVQVTSTVGVRARFARLLCSSAATGQTGTVVGITGSN